MRFLPAALFSATLLLAACGNAPPAGRAAAGDPLATSGSYEKAAALALMTRCHARMAGGDKDGCDSGAIAGYMGISAEDAAKAVARMDRNGNGRVARLEAYTWAASAAAVAYLRQGVLVPMCHAADTDDDGKVSLEEARQATYPSAAGPYALAAAAGRPLGVRDADFTRADRNRDGALSEGEFGELASRKIRALGNDEAPLDQLLGQIWFKAIPWSH